MPAEKLLFIDTNIWLDFYRARKDAGLKLLKNVEALSDNLIVTYQLESEFKRNRQNVLMDSWDSLKPPNELGFPNIVADAKASKMLAKHMKEAKARVARGLAPTDSQSGTHGCRRCAKTTTFWHKSGMANTGPKASRIAVRQGRNGKAGHHFEADHRIPEPWNLS